VQWKKYQIKIICVLAFLFVAIPTANSIERLGYLGQTWSFPIFFTTPQSNDEITYHLDTSYFLHERWSANLSINAQLAGLELFYLELGPDFYPIQDKTLIPFISARLLYTMIPNGDAGWQINVGFETHLSKSSQLENLRLRAGTGVGQLFLDSQTVLFTELVRVGLIWCF
jgi:CDP-glycerol glycerophosphotransferase (TagB/SpsB family)